VGRLVADGNQLLLCFDGGDIPNGTADWGAPDTVILYEVSSGALLRENQTTGGTRVLARHVTQLALADLGDSIRIELTLAYRDWTRTYTLIGRDP
jgi:hypothetical protein